MKTWTDAQKDDAERLVGLLLGLLLMWFVLTHIRWADPYRGYPPAVTQAQGTPDASCTCDAHHGLHSGCTLAGYATHCGYGRCYRD